MPSDKMNDTYSKLRPEPPTPKDEICDCANISEIYLAHKLGSNPIHCLGCSGEVLPDRLEFGERLAETIAYWNSVYGSLYQLWLDSGEYEDWARDRLLDPKGQVNTTGIDLVKELSSFAKAYYLWFYENTSQAPDRCLLCGANLIVREGILFKFCEPCLLIT
ncbi:hypothetical protein D1AOALGA4SA_1486 [Olavius algarvensis Delta 1 endosymbiont]|nr:hypothetical protein D1AOALGA4SA_1486 [Olavius algarvensis Delta 1 endosymbiont]